MFIKHFREKNLLRMTGLEPARRKHQNLNLARLPIPPYPQDRIASKLPNKIIKNTI